MGAKWLRIFSAAHGARLDFEGAARELVEYGFLWACEFGRKPVVEFLLDRGFDVNTKRRETGLHGAEHSGHAEIVQLLLARGAAVDIRDDRFDGTPAEWARYARGSTS